MRLVKKIEPYKKILAAIAALTLAISCSAVLYAFQSEAETNRLVELRDAGYTKEQIMDQMSEEFYSNDGKYGTGGIDGKLLNGSIAPNGILAGTSSSGNTGDSKPSHTCSYDTETVTKEATCTEKGVLTLTCSCGKTKTKNIEKIEHNYVAGQVIPATCIEKGRTELKCTYCGDSYWVETTYAEHIYVPSENSIAATCTEDGSKVTVCSVCGDTVTETISALGHEESTVAAIEVSPQCETDGLLQYICNRCGVVLRQEPIPPNGHTKGGVLFVEQEPTFMADGTGVYKCSDCGKVLETVILPKEDLPYAVFIVGGVTVVMTIGVTCVVIKKEKKG